MTRTLFSIFKSARLLITGAVVGVTATCLVSGLQAQQPQQNRSQLTNPVFRVANSVEPKKGVHPLDPALDKARSGLNHIQADIADYQCTLVKRERINGVLGDYEYMHTKVRNRKVVNGKVVVTLGVYMSFLKPEKIRGREVLYVEGANNGKMIAHEGGGGLAGILPSLWLRPDGPVAMRGNRYPITEVGIEMLVLRLIEKGERDKRLGLCKVKFVNKCKVSGRICTMLQVTQIERKKEHDFYVARVFIDDELNIPVRYAAYDWPKKTGTKPELIEEYTYMDLKVNPGFKAVDFDHENDKYNF
jgi:hypothetical protein